MLQGDRGHGERLAVLLVAVVGGLSLVTGVANLAATTRFELVAQFVPEVVRTAVALTGAFTGFTTLLVAYGLKRRLRSAWLAAVVLLPVTALQGVVQSSPLSLPLVVLSVAAMPTLVVHRHGFRRATALSTSQKAAALTLAAVLTYGTVGGFVLRDDFANLATPLDAFYYTVVTASTVGYGDVAPLSATARTFSLSLIVVGTAGFALAIAAVITPGIEARLTSALGKMTASQLELLEDHVIVLGYGELTEPVLSELEGTVDYVVVTDDAAAASRLGERGVDVVQADPSDESSLEKVRIGEAVAVVAATNDDGADALAVLTARQLNPDVRVVAAATERENVEKLRRAGADAVVSPASIAGHMLVESALGGADAEAVAAELLDGGDAE